MVSLRYDLGLRLICLGSGLRSTYCSEVLSMTGVCWSVMMVGLLLVVWDLVFTYAADLAGARSVWNMMSSVCLGSGLPMSCLWLAYLILVCLRYDLSVVWSVAGLSCETINFHLICLFLVCLVSHLLVSGLWLVCLKDDLPVICSLKYDQSVV